MSSYHRENNTGIIFYWLRTKSTRAHFNPNHFSVFYVQSSWNDPSVCSLPSSCQILLHLESNFETKFQTSVVRWSWESCFLLTRRRVRPRGGGPGTGNRITGESRLRLRPPRVTLLPEPEPRGDQRPGGRKPGPIRGKYPHWMMRIVKKFSDGGSEWCFVETIMNRI